MCSTCNAFSNLEVYQLAGSSTTQELAETQWGAAQVVEPLDLRQGRLALYGVFDGV